MSRAGDNPGNVSFAKLELHHCGSRHGSYTEVEKIDPTPRVALAPAGSAEPPADGPEMPCHSIAITDLITGLHTD